MLRYVLTMRGWIGMIRLTSDSDGQKSVMAYLTNGSGASNYLQSLIEIIVDQRIAAVAKASKS